MALLKGKTKGEKEVVFVVTCLSKSPLDAHFMARFVPDALDVSATFGLRLLEKHIDHTLSTHVFIDKMPDGSSRAGLHCLLRVKPHILPAYLDSELDRIKMAINQEIFEACSKHSYLAPAEVVIPPSQSGNVQ